MNELLNRLDVAATTGYFSKTLVSDLRSALITHLPDIDRRTLQETLIRQAGDLLPGTPWQRAEQLAAMIRRWSGHQSDPIRALLYQAAQTGRKLPQSQRQIYRILTSNSFTCQ
ncbi:MAG: hypothetical protein KDI73_02395 [Candidatus Competibacteraceae bacterium]|mgnify:CR=1 FL=1|nr:hypothetical protein [Candidatus Competibacteraceae bacterium]HRY14698.1 hypothetical protein [Candidatus Competibacteraceae bacterium]